MQSPSSPTAGGSKELYGAPAIQLLATLKTTSPLVLSESLRGRKKKKSGGEESGPLNTFPCCRLTLTGTVPNRFPLEFQYISPGRCKVRWSRSNGFLTSGPLVYTGVPGTYPGPTVRTIIMRIPFQSYLASRLRYPVQRF